MSLDLLWSLKLRESVTEYISVIKNIDRNTERSHRDQVLLHEWSQHVMSDGGHDVAEVQSSDGATFALVFLRESLPGMF